MTKTSRTLALALLASTSLAHADVAADKADLWQRAGHGTHNTGNVALGFFDQCIAAYNRLHTAGVADSETIVIAGKEGDYYNVKAGTYTVGQIHADCVANKAKVVAAQVAEEKQEALQQTLRSVAIFAGLVRQEIADLDGGKDVTNMKKYAANCHETVRDALAAGAPASTPVMVSMYAKPEWNGTLADVETAWCAAGDARFAKFRTERIGPFIKAGLKNDKLSMIEEVYPEPYYLPGGQGSTDPAKLAKANVWFWDSPSDEACGIRKSGEDVDVRVKHSLHRYQFDGQGKVTKESTKAYCGDPPAKAYR